MKKLLIIASVLFCSNTYSQYHLRFPDTENFIIKTHWHYHFNETESNNPGLNYVIEAGYTGKIYALIGYESFSALKGAELDGLELNGYTSFHGAIGFNLTYGYHEQWNYNTGIRLVKAYRGPIREGFMRCFIGWEGGITYFFRNGFGIGLRGTLDYRYDQEVFGWKPEYILSSYFTVSKKF
ncbi:hypothetical protein [Aestuariibaculum marinum]|uniref:Uncharacterized protein n=1 Tax=Aestuariibaculum marinum TaxID=2683592 RepID=A0A8J6PNV2_9FLAO|nr:hypothetical protein [Aestuariibaculum marinum]MBD0822619.1 hypothetical protein [Aestuariibaculum marinum]